MPRNDLKNNNFLKYSGLVTEIFTCLAVAAYFGRLLDRKFEMSKPILTASCPIIVLILLMIWLNYDLKKQEEWQTPGFIYGWSWQLLFVWFWVYLQVPVLIPVKSIKQLTYWYHSLFFLPLSFLFFRIMQSGLLIHFYLQGFSWYLSVWRSYSYHYLWSAL